MLRIKEKQNYSCNVEVSREPTVFSDLITGRLFEISFLRLVAMKVLLIELLPPFPSCILCRGRIAFHSFFYG